MALTDAKIRAAKAEEKSYKLTDGAGLHLLIHTNGSRYWRLRYRHQGKEKTLALGIYPIVSLSEARNKRDEARKLIAVGIDPTEKKRTEKAAASTELSFETMTRRWLNTNRKWSDSHRLKVIRSFETHIFPLIGQRIINSLTTPDLLMPVRQAENQEIFETANRLQQRIASVMRYAVQSGIISYNPALDTSGAITTVKVRHRPALALSRISELVKRIDNYSGYPMTQVAVMLNLLVFTRSSELRYARWSEIDFKGSLWTIPAERIPIPNVRFSHRGAKMRTPHLVPLSHQAITLLRILYDWTGEHELILTGAHNPHIPLSENTVNKALRLMGYDTKTDICGHGFRSMACSSLIESGLWSKDAVERQMSHQERNDVRAAYIHKAEHLDERRLMVQWWADFIDANRQQTISPFDYAKANNPFR